MKENAERRLIETPAGGLEVFIAAVDAGLRGPIVAAAHPAGVFGESAAELLRDRSEASAVCVNPRGLGGSAPLAGGERAGLVPMVEDLEAVRRALELDRWTFWGMSGGGWLGLAYSRLHPKTLGGLLLESGCPCFRLRLADPACILSPFHSSWRPALERRGMIDPGSHEAPGDAKDSEWLEVEGVGTVFRRRRGPALLVSPTPVTPEMRAAMPMLWDLDFRKDLGAIHTPTLVIGGSADGVVPTSHVRSLHEGIPGSRCLIVEGGGHVPTTTRDEGVGRAVRAFVREVAP